LANELGWLVSELGRQPWVVYGVFRTASAITTASGLGVTFAGFTMLYLGLSVVTIWGVRRITTGTPDLGHAPAVSVV
jgi:cytochrome d ubiquinol oxidase subunit I